MGVVGSGDDDRVEVVPAEELPVVLDRDIGTELLGLAPPDLGVEVADGGDRRTLSGVVGGGRDGTAQAEPDDAESQV